jgi:hypothetical protein
MHVTFSLLSNNLPCFTKENVKTIFLLNMLCLPLVPSSFTLDGKKEEQKQESNNQLPSTKNQLN